MTANEIRKNQPWALRAWHWLDAIAILGLLGTVLLRKTFLSWRTNAAFIEGELQQAGTPATPEVAKAIAVALRDRMWEWHHYFGFALVGLLVVRLIIAIVVPSERPVPTALRAVRAFRSAESEKGEAAHVAVVKLGYAVFYASVLVMAVTGLLQYFEAALGLSEGLAGAVGELHELMMWFFVLFAGGHVLGVVVAEHRGAAGIVSDMIGGGPRE